MKSFDISLTAEIFFPLSSELLKSFTVAKKGGEVTPGVGNGKKCSELGNQNTTFVT